MSLDAPAVEPVAAPQVDYAKGLAWTMGFAALMKVTVGVVTIYIARRLPLAELGIFGVLGNIYIFAEQMREAGLKQAFYNDSNISAIKFRTYARTSVMSGLTFAILLSLLSVPLATFFATPRLAWSVVWAAFATFMNALSLIPMAALNKEGKFRDVGMIESGANLLSVGVALGLVFLGWGFGALVAQLVVRSTITFALTYWQKPYSILNHDPAEARSILRICTPLVTTDILWLFYSLADQFAIMKILGIQFGASIATAAGGYYQQGMKILGIPGDLIYFPLIRTFVVAFGNRSSDLEHLGRTFLKGLNLAILLLVSMFGAAAMLAKPLVLAALTAKFAGTIPIIGIICITNSFKLTGSFAGSSLVAAGKSKIPLYAWLLPYPVAAIGIALTWNHTTLETIAWSYAAGMVVVNVVVLAAAFRFLKISRKQVGRFGECLLIAAGTTSIAYAISLLPLKPWPHVLLALAVLPFVHGMIIGIVFARKPFAYFSRSGIRLLRESL